MDRQYTKYQWLDLATGRQGESLFYADGMALGLVDALLIVNTWNNRPGLMRYWVLP